MTTTKMMSRTRTSAVAAGTSKTSAVSISFQLPGGREYVAMHAGCPGESGPGHYAAGHRPDVQDVPAGVQPSVHEIAALSVALAIIAL
jgi:hypothetical protein